jgi:hypothetical protein
MRTATESGSAKSSILDTVGNTPIIELSKIFGDSRFKLFGKIEAMNPGGSGWQHQRPLGIAYAARSIVYGRNISRYDHH